MGKLRLFEMFAGYGGARWALLKANINFDCVGFSEIKKEACEVYLLNFPNTINYGDCTQIDPMLLPNFDLLTGGFPCQDVSMAGKNDLSKGRTTLFNEIIRIASIKKPKYILLENVKGLQAKKHSQFFSHILKSLDDIGYKVYYKILDSKKYNTPQSRERIFFVCIRKDLKESKLKEYDWPKEERLTRHWRDYEDNPLNFKKVNKTPSRDIMRQRCRNITNEQYSSTITLKQDRWPNAGIIDFDNYYRFLTPKEQFRLQGFFFDEINLNRNPPFTNSQLESLAGDGWDINLVSKIFKILLKDYVKKPSLI